MPRVDRQAAVASARSLDQGERGVERVHVDVERHELVDDLCRRVVRGVLTELSKRFGELLQPARGSGDVADLDVVGVERGRGVEQQLPPRIGIVARRLARRHEEVGQELDLQMAQAGVVEHLLHLPETVALQLVLDVGVPEPETAEADTGGLRAAIAPGEGAPLSSDVHLGGPGDRPVQGHQVDFAHRVSSSLRRTMCKLPPPTSAGQPSRAGLLVTTRERPGRPGPRRPRRGARAMGSGRSRSRAPDRSRRRSASVAASPVGSPGRACT